MKSAILAITLLASGGAAAQSAPIARPDLAAQVWAALNATPAETPAPAAQTVAPSNANPERDARGIAVISAPAIAPAGFNQPPGTAVAMGGPLEPVAATEPVETYPACTRTVTDHCLQTYERGRGPQ